MTTTTHNNNEYIEVTAETVSSTKVPSNEEVREQAFIKAQEAIRQSKLPEFVIKYLLMIGEVSHVNLGLVIEVLKPIYFIAHIAVTWGSKIVQGLSIGVVLFIISCFVLARASQKLLNKIPNLITSKFKAKPLDIKPVQTYNVQINIPTV